MNISQTFGTKVFLILFAFLLLLLIVVTWLKAIRDSQFRPHRITTSINGQILTDHMVTNPAYVTFEYQTRPGPNGLEIIAKPVTNYYWHQWEIFK